MGLGFGGLGFEEFRDGCVLRLLRQHFDPL